MAKLFIGPEDTLTVNLLRAKLNYSILKVFVQMFVTAIYGQSCIMHYN